MIQICARPTNEPVVNREGVYVLEFKLGPFEYKPLLKVRARTAALAEEKLEICFERELEGKLIDFDVEAYEEKILEELKERKNENGLPDEGEVQSALQKG